MKNLQTWLISLKADHRPNFDECVAMLGDIFPLLNAFRHTEQDPEWHAEGNVAIHTDWVLAELYSLLNDEASHITGEKRRILILSALLHDIAKPLTTKSKELNGKIRVVAPKHEELGRNYLITRLVTLPLDYESIKAIMGLVGFHQMPKLLVLKNLGFSHYFQLSLDADLALLYWLELADMRGRRCSDLPMQIEFLEQFKMFAEDYQLWDNQDPGKSITQDLQIKDTHSEQVYLDASTVRGMAYGQINVAQQALAKYFEPAQQYSHLYLTCGISGSGKSTWIDKNLKGFDVISLDGIRAELNGKASSQKNRGQILQLAKSRLKHALAKKRNVVWDATNIRKDFRQVICDLGFDYKALVTLVAFQLNEHALRENNQNRNRSVADDVISKQVLKFEWPTATEAHRMIVVGDKGQELHREGAF